MHEYKVIFENNVPVHAARLAPVEGTKLVHISKQGKKKIMNWLVVYGDSESDAIEIAKKVINTIWSEYLS